MAGERDATSFFVDTDHFDSDQNVDALLTGQKWDTSSSNVITFSFIDSGADLSYSAGVTFANQFSAVQQNAARRALDEFANVADVRFVEIGDDPGENNANGTIRFADYSGLSTAFGYYPNSGESGGDLFFSDGSFESAPLGSYEFVTFMHELGHGMGLKHGHEESGGSGFPDVGSLEPDRDGMEYSVMTYNSFIGQNLMPGFFTNSSGHYAQTLMIYDIAALQRMYGPNWGHNGGDTVYSWDPSTGRTFHNGTGQAVPEAAVIFRTEWDGGGTDTYDLSNFTTDLMIDLRPGMYSDFDVGGNQLRARLNAGWDSSGNYVGASEHEYASGHVYNALQFEGNEMSLIENATGGSGDDEIQGNVTGNALRGNGGRDTLVGNEGNDTLEGGSQQDSLVGGAGDDEITTGDGADYVDAGQGTDRVVYAGLRADFTISVQDGVATVTGSAGTDTLVGVETIVFDDQTVSLIEPEPETGFGETGTVTLNHDATTVTLQRSYENPVVIAYVATENGNQPVNVRVSSASGNELTLQLQEPNSLDGNHVNETVNYLVVEAGTWVLPDGSILEAGTVNSNQLSSQGFETVAFDAEFDSAPVILSQVQTLNGGDFVTTRQRTADADGFQLTMQEEEAKNGGGHVTETIGWIAIEPGSGTAGGVGWLAGSTSGVTDANATVGLGSSIAGGANVIAALSSFAGPDPAWARGNDSTNTTFDVSVEEETSQDAETNHTTESVDYFVFDSPGTLSAAPMQDVLETGTVTLNHDATTVTLQRNYENPVVIAYVATENGNQPVNVRVSSASGNELTLQLQEPNSLDGNHVHETVNYLVVEAGTWVLPDGSILEAGTVNSNQLSSQGFETVAFDAQFDSAPVILSQVQTFNGGDFVTTRQRGADADGFQLTMQEEEAKNGGGHVTESIGWVAIEPGSGTAGGVGWLAGSTSGVTDANATVGLGSSISGGANVIAALSSFAGPDTAWARGNDSTITSFDVSVEEETSQDSETNHTTESVDYFVFDGFWVVEAYDYDFFA